ncbi:MAG: hypothetical protein Q7S74_04210 [Nanoarchaeota archaeon]|nr:hypothetical protein [Nanoarchaeota archaeon]
MEESKDTIHINGKVIAVIVILLLLIVSTLGMFFLNGRTTSSSSDSMIGYNENSGLTSNSMDDKYGNLPEKCRLPAGQDVNSWKEHLGHHAETQDCLKYFK